MQRIKTVEAVDGATLFVRAIGNALYPKGIITSISINSSRVIVSYAVSGSLLPIYRNGYRSNYPVK